MYEIVPIHGYVEARPVPAIPGAGILDAELGRGIDVRLDKLNRTALGYVEERCMIYVRRSRLETTNSTDQTVTVDGFQRMPERHQPIPVTLKVRYQRGGDHGDHVEQALTVGEAAPFQPVHRVSLVNTELNRRFRVCHVPSQIEYFRPGGVTVQLHLDVKAFKGPADLAPNLPGGHKGALPGGSHEQTFLDQLRDRLPNRGSAHVQSLGYALFRRDRVSIPEVSDMAQYKLLDLEVQG